MNKIVESKRQTVRQLHRFIHLISSSHPEAERPNDKLQPGRSRTENSLLSVTETVPKLSPVRGRWGPAPLRTGWLWWLRWTSWSCRCRNSERQRPKPRTRWIKPRRVQQSPADSSQICSIWAGACGKDSKQPLNSYSRHNWTFNLGFRWSRVPSWSKPLHLHASLIIESA